MGNPAAAAMELHALNAVLPSSWASRSRQIARWQRIPATTTAAAASWDSAAEAASPQASTGKPQPRRPDRRLRGDVTSCKNANWSPLRRLHLMGQTTAMMMAERCFVIHRTRLRLQMRPGRKLSTRSWRHRMLGFHGAAPLQTYHRWSRVLRWARLRQHRRAWYLKIAWLRQWSMLRPQLEDLFLA